MFSISSAIIVLLLGRNLLRCKEGFKMLTHANTVPVLVQDLIHVLDDKHWVLCPLEKIQETFEDCMKK